MTQLLQNWPRIKPPKAQKEGTRQGKSPKPPQEPPVDGYWQEWTPEDPLANNGYCTQLYLPPGAFIVNAAVSIRLAAEAPGPSEVECSLFVGSDNRFLNQVTLAPGEGASLAATAHVDSTEPTEVQWNCGATTAPFRLQLAVTAIKVHHLFHVGTQPGT